MLFANKKTEPIAAGGGTSIIGSAITIQGDLNSTADIRVDGTVRGNVKSTARILIGAEGVVEGDIEGQQADIMGTVKGNIKVKDLLSLREKATIAGDIYAGKLVVEPTASFNGHCHMNHKPVVEMVKEKHEQQKVASK